MKSTAILLATLTFSGFACAQDPVAEGEVIMINLKSPSEDCDGIFKSMAKPKLPASLPAQHTLIRQGACSVTLSFSVLTSGEIDSVEIDTVEERCKPFVRASLSALKNSTFNEQKIKKYCYHTYTYELQ